MTWLSDLSGSSADCTIRWPMSLCNLPIAMASVRDTEHQCEGMTVPVWWNQSALTNTLYLWHSGTLWWHCLGGAQTHRTSRICYSLLDLQTPRRNLGKKTAYWCVNNSSPHHELTVQMADHQLWGGLLLITGHKAGGGLTGAFLQILQLSVCQVHIRVHYGPVLPVPCQSGQNSTSKQIKVSTQSPQQSGKVWSLKRTL